MCLWRIVIHREYTDRSLTAPSNHRRLTGKIAVPIDTLIDPCPEKVRKRKQARTGIVHCRIREGASRQTGLVELGRDTARVCEGRDGGVVHVEAVGERQERGSRFGVLGELVDERGGEVGVDDRGIGVAGVGRLVDVQVAALAVETAAGESLACVSIWSCGFVGRRVD